MRLIRRDDLIAQPWKNGGGVTWQIASAPVGAGLDDFDWRISMAEIASDGPFSVFAGIDRTLTLLDGAGVTLDFGGGRVTLAPGAPPLSFPGEAPVTARLTGGPVLDLNVMTRRGALAHSARLIPAGTRAPAGTAALVALGATNVDGHAIGHGDTLLAERNQMPEISANAVAVVLWTTVRNATAGFPDHGG